MNRRVVLIASITLALGTITSIAVYEIATEHEQRSVESSDEPIVPLEAIETPNIPEDDHTRWIEHYTRLITGAPENAWHFTCRGHRSYAIGDVDSALGDFNRAIDLNETEVLARIGRGGILAQRGNRRAAIKDLTVALNTDPSLLKLCILRDTLEYQLGQFKRTIEDCDRFIQAGYRLSRGSHFAWVREATAWT